MNKPLLNKLAAALLYEGYMLYPYRPSVKNVQRWTFGGIYPRSWCQAQGGADSFVMQTECLLTGSEQTRVQIIVRFLHLIDRRVADLDLHELPELRLGDRIYQPWQEAQEREIDLGHLQLDGPISITRQTRFEFPENRSVETLLDESGEAAGALIRAQRSIRGSIEVSASMLDRDLYKLTVRITNDSPVPVESSADGRIDRDAALMRSLVSTHTLLGIENGQFISMTDPPDEVKPHSDRCQNIGAWPVLVGVETERDMILSSPIILYDYPQLAPESPGDLFDSTEIDEILTLRILTLTDDEKRTAAGVDPRVRELLARTESLARDQLAGLHGTLRGLHPVIKEPADG